MVKNIIITNIAILFVIFLGVAAAGFIFQDFTFKPENWTQDSRGAFVYFIWFTFFWGNIILFNLLGPNKNN